MGIQSIPIQILKIPSNFLSLNCLLNTCSWGFELGVSIELNFQVCFNETNNGRFPEIYIPTLVLTYFDTICANCRRPRSGANTTPDLFGYLTIRLLIYLKILMHRSGICIKVGHG